MSELEKEKIKSFYEYLEKRLKEKQKIRSNPGINNRAQDLLKTEIAEIEVILNNFKNTFGELS